MQDKGGKPVRLTHQIAEQILNEIRTVIEEDINIMDETGLIIASTDSDRLNTFHEGAKLLIQGDMERLVVTDDDQYRGCRRGANLPIHFGSDIIGVIGITGDPHQTVKYGLILKKMTEMLLIESLRMSQQFGSQQEKNMIINDLIHGNFNNLQYNLEELMKRSGIAVSGKYTAAILKNTSSSDGYDHITPFSDSIVRKVIDEISSPEIHIMFNGTVFIILACCDHRQLYGCLETASARLNKDPDISIFCAVGNDYDDYMDIHRSYNEAGNIISYFDCREGETGIYPFNNIMLDYVIEQLPEMHKENLSRIVFERCTGDEVTEMCDFIISFFNANGSLTALAERYFSHKNTIQYRIKKIRMKTGYDLRSSHDLFVLYIAALYASQRKRD